MQLTFLLSSLLAASAAATPTATIDKRAQTWCDSFGSLQTNGYVVYHNNWGSGSASSGRQCTTFDKVNSGNSFVWSTEWTWVGGAGQVKSYANVALEKVHKKLSQIKSIPSKWTWRYTGTNMISNVSYDLWLAPSTTAKNSHEIMVWVGAYGGAGPISETGSTIATPTVLGSKWKLFKGTNEGVIVFSFVAEKNIGNFEGDLNEFYKYLTSNQGVSKDLYVTSLQAGTEPFEGSNAVLKTSAYTITVNSN
ncbi:concanavalin A-like lectin/glucanase domain-containing protein [Ilyonectria sp. MPI-CAGE-AT-0026]|nr:concanavalin A-like lectin/glucanase domain-containing protein [Ilyonectria sp. MPI-CAGE-AT-0026]